VPIRIRIGRRIFAPGWLFTLLTLALCSAFIVLGRWQWHRGHVRQAEWDRFAAGTSRIESLGARGVEEVTKFQRVSLVGRYDANHQFILDNRIDQGRAGFEVLTPLQRPNGRTVLVDRGWLPQTGYRTRLPEIALSPQEPVTVTGRVADLPSGGLASGKAPPPSDGHWPKLTSFPTLDQLATALGVPLEPRIVLLDREAPEGYARDWHPPGIDPMRNWSYALQWWCFAVITLWLWVRFSLRKPADSP
jgi:surfeit locus 1 family protein